MQNLRAVRIRWRKLKLKAFSRYTRPFVGHWCEAIKILTERGDRSKCSNASSIKRQQLECQNLLNCVRWHWKNLIWLSTAPHQLSLADLSQSWHITACLQTAEPRFETGWHLWKHLVQSGISYSILQRVISKWVLNISKHGDATTFQGTPFLCSVSFTLKRKSIFYT